MPRRNKRAHQPYQAQKSSYEYKSMQSMRDEFDFENGLFFSRIRGGAIGGLSGYMPVYISISTSGGHKYLCLSFAKEEYKKLKCDRVKIGVISNNVNEKRLYVIKDDNGYKITTTNDQRYRARFTLEDSDIKLFNDFTGSHDGFLYDAKHDAYYVEQIIKEGEK